MAARIAFPLTLALLSLITLVLDPGRGAAQQPPLVVQVNGGNNQANQKPGPGDIYDKHYANPRGFILVSDLKDGRQTMARWLEQQGIKDWKEFQITKEVFIKWSEFREQQRLKSYTDPVEIDKRALEAFNDYDRNRDKVLDREEYKRTQNFKFEWQKWDTNRDGLIDLNEWKVYYRDYNQRVVDLMDLNADGKPESKSYTPIKPVVREVDASEESPLVAPRAGKLPSGLPDWFKKLDLDIDGQISVFEWKKADKDVDEFFKMDRNDDGFLTADEVLRHTRELTAAPKTGAADEQTAGDKKDPSDAAAKKIKFKVKGG